MKHRILVMGAGAWGTALALHMARTGAQVYLWARNPARLPSGAMPRLPDFPLPDSITVSSAPPPADVACALMVIPTQHMASVLPLVPVGVPAVLCCKGIERSTLAFPLDVLHRLRPDMPGAVLSGPNFAREVAANLPAASVVASANMELARKLVDLLSTPRLRLYASADITGVQLGGAAKNVIAVAAGITIGAGLGENARAALITRGLAEITRLGVALGAQPATLAGLAGLGDLLLTCTGEASRNYQMGLALGRGNAAQSALATLPGVAEGVTTADALLALARHHKVDVPITACIAAFLEGKITLPQAQEQLLTRPLRTELDTP